MSPIRPENRDRYPADWREISRRIRFDRAAGRCECQGECGRPGVHLAADGRCPRRHGDPIPARPDRKVVLTTAHLNHVPEDVRDENLLALCQACHLFMDRAHHATTRDRRKAAAHATEPLL